MFGNWELASGTWKSFFLEISSCKACSDSFPRDTNSQMQVFWYPYQAQKTCQLNIPWARFISPYIGRNVSVYFIPREGLFSAEHNLKGLCAAECWDRHGPENEMQDQQSWRIYYNEESLGYIISVGGGGKVRLYTVFGERGSPIPENTLQNYLKTPSLYHIQTSLCFDEKLSHAESQAARRYHSRAADSLSNYSALTSSDL